MKKSKKTSQSKNSIKQKKRKATFGPEISAVIILFTGLFLVLCLMSYNAQDPSWANAVPSGQKISNIGGKVGATISDALLQGFGFPSYFIPFILFYFSFLLLRNKEKKQVVSKIFLSIILILILSSLFSILFNTIQWRGMDIPAGGITGNLCSSFLAGFFNHIGSILILATLLFLFILFTTSLSIKKIFHALSKIFQFTFQKIRIRITHYQKNKTKEKNRKKVLEKHLGPTRNKVQLQVIEKGRKNKKTKERKKSPANQNSRIPSAQKKIPAQEILPFPEPAKKSGYQIPPINLLDRGKKSEQIDKNELLEKKQLIEEKLLQFGIKGEVRQYHPGPILTTYEYFPDAGIKVSQVTNRAEEVSLALAAISVRIRRIPGKSSLGIEVPNNVKEHIKIRDIIESEEFQESKSKLTYALGKTVQGETYITDITKMPHLLIAGATGTGKSVALNALIASIIYKATPEEVKMILIDPKRIELSIYEGIPHLLCPVVKAPKKAEAVLLSAIKMMEKRYRKLGVFNVRNIEQYNQMVANILNDNRRKLTEEELDQLKPLPFIIIVIDELAELMMTGAKEVNYYISRLAQLARAVGIHLIMATQRPSVDVITGTIKNNFSSRIAFRVPTKVDSRVILDTIGADKLLGDGDMLFIPPKYPRIIRLHGSFITASEVNRIIRYVKEQGKPQYDNKLIEVLKKPIHEAHEDEEIEKDPLFNKAVEIILMAEKASVSYLQRRLKLGYTRAARIVDQMEQEGIVGTADGSKPREILVNSQEYLNKMRKNIYE